jgi:hypothetical protein
MIRRNYDRPNRQIRGIARKRKLNLKLELVFLFDRRTTVITCSIPLVSRLRLAATVSGPVSGQEKAAHPGLYYRGAAGLYVAAMGDRARL